MLTLLVGVLNHLLTSANWARNRLAPFAGRIVAFVIPPFHFALAVEPDGLFRPAAADAASDVTISLPADSPLRLFSGMEQVLAAAHVAGNAEFATALSFVIRHLRWDVEEDLSRLVGDIAAHRLVAAGARLCAWQREAANRCSDNFSEYLRYESRLLVAREELIAFSEDIMRLNAELAALEKRLAHIEQELRA